MYYLYEIYYQNAPIYVGMTNNVKRRQYQHNYHFKKKNRTKKLYDFLEENNFTDDIELVVIQTFKSKVECKRRECYLILKDYYEENKLLNKIPSISDR